MGTPPRWAEPDPEPEPAPPARRGLRGCGQDRLYYRAQGNLSSPCRPKPQPSMGPEPRWCSSDCSRGKKRQNLCLIVSLFTTSLGAEPCSRRQSGGSPTSRSTSCILQPVGTTEVSSAAHPPLLYKNTFLQTSVLCSQP